MECVGDKEQMECGIYFQLIHDVFPLMVLAPLKVLVHENVNWFCVLIYQFYVSFIYLELN